MFGRVRWRSEVLNAVSFEKRLKANVFSTIITKNGFNGAIKIFFYKSFKVREDRCSIIFMFERVEPNILREMIDKDDVVFEGIKRNNGGCPNITVDTSNGLRDWIVLL